MVSFLTVFYITFSWLTFVVNIALVASLFRNFLKKKTSGTLILFISYLFIGIGALISALVYTFQISGLGDQAVISLQTISILLPQAALLFIYVFSCRHILRDNEVIKTFTIIFLTAYNAFIGTLYFLNNFGITPGFNSTSWWAINKNTIQNTGLYNSNISFLSLTIMVFQVYINMRITARAFILAGRTNKLIRKRGLQLIAWGLIAYMTAGILISIEYAFDWTVDNPLPLILWILRNIIYFVAYFILYLGWIMPDWYRRRIRKRTWFEEKYNDYKKAI
jgi:hypothetical protein